MYKSSNAPLAFKTIDQEIRDSKMDMVYVIILDALKNKLEKFTRNFYIQRQVGSPFKQNAVLALVKKHFNTNRNLGILTVPEGWSCLLHMGVYTGLWILHQSFLN